MNWLEHMKITPASDQVWETETCLWESLREQLVKARGLVLFVTPPVPAIMSQLLMTDQEGSPPVFPASFCSVKVEAGRMAICWHPWEKHPEWSWCCAVFHADPEIHTLMHFTCCVLFFFNPWVSLAASVKKGMDFLSSTSYLCSNGQLFENSQVARNLYRGICEKSWESECGFQVHLIVVRGL